MSTLDDARMPNLKDKLLDQEETVEAVKAAKKAKKKLKVGKQLKAK